MTGLMRQLVCGSDLARSHLIGIFRAFVFMLDNLSSQLSQLFDCLLTDQFEQVLEDSVESSLVYSNDMKPTGYELYRWTVCTVWLLVDPAPDQGKGQTS